MSETIYTNAKFERLPLMLRFMILLGGKLSVHVSVRCEVDPGGVETIDTKVTSWWPWERGATMLAGAGKARKGD